MLFIEASVLPGGKGQLLLTGQLGNVMQESARAAVSHIRAEAGTLGFTLYRELRGKLVKLNRSLIPAGAHAYSWLDTRAPAGPVRYRLQAVSSSGVRAWLGSALVAR